MQGIVWDGDGVVLAEVPEPDPPEGWVVADVAYVGVCGSDLHLAHGLHPRGRRHVVMGHEFVATVDGRPVFVDPAVTDGTCAHCRSDTRHLCGALGVLGVDAPGALAPRVAVPTANLVPLPDGIALADGAVLEPLSVALRGVRRSGLQPGDHLHVVGYGPIGCLAAHVGRLSGAGRVTVSELSPGRAATAAAHGFEVLTEPDRAAQVVVDCVGTAGAARALTYWAATHGTVSVVGMTPGHVPVDLQDVILRELRVVGSRAYSRADVAAAVGLMERDEVRADLVVTSVVDLPGVPAAFGRLERGEDSKVLVRLR